MRRYQIMTIIDPAVGETKVADVQRSIEVLIEERGGNIEQGARPQRMQLATPIQGNAEGFRGYSIITLPEDKISELQDLLRHQEGLLRSMVVSLTEEARSKGREGSGRPVRRSQETTNDTPASAPFADEQIAREINAVIEREVEKVSQEEEKAKTANEVVDQEPRITEEELKDIDDQLDKMLEDE